VAQTILEVHHLLAVFECRERGPGSLQVRGMDEVEEGAREQLLARVPERLLERRIDTLEETIEPGDA
jgi:hypothetical protein